MIPLAPLWRNRTKDGEDYWSGPLNQRVRIVVLRNAYKRGDRDPDFMLYLAETERKDSAAQSKPQGQDRGRY